MNFSLLAVLYIFFGFGWWFLALTCCLPLTILLILSTNFRSAFFSWFYTTVIDPSVRTITDVARKKTFQILEESIEDRNSLVPLEVLEIGVGHGPNLKFYPENCKLTVLDKNKFFEKLYSNNKNKYPQISYQKTIIQPAEQMKGIEDNSFDVVVSTFLHCSCDDSVAVLREVKRVLKPGGKYLFMDHVAFPEGDIGLCIQRFVNPLWSLMFNGCHLDRNASEKIKEAGFSDVYFQKHVFRNVHAYLFRNLVLGIVTK
ncbi:methyltransferase-like protein 7A [Nephila pilipes]|uniref:Methyltransferase-like protein 7A n=1 Tax=Nephila pilipes TaxID=299642 RepID=A0A8X6TIX5_NEPPI|nr:methyltransferase-like protein 7A [Nephila pilipes]